jgi:hypothetical protein
MNRSFAVTSIAAAAFLLLTVPAPAGSGIGKGKTAPMGDTVSGTISSVDPESTSFLCNCGGGTWTFLVHGDTIIRKSDDLASFADLSSGESVTVRYHTEGQDMDADLVIIGP